MRSIFIPGLDGSNDAQSLPWRAPSSQNIVMLSEDRARFLAACRIGHLATADAQGVPHLVPVCFAVSDGTLYITIDQKPKGEPRRLKRLRNISENPVAAFVVDRWDEDWTRLGWVMLRGPAEILAEGAEHDRAQALLRARYPQYRAMEIAELPVIAIRISRVTSWGNLSVQRAAVGGGYTG